MQRADHRDVLRLCAEGATVLDVLPRRAYERTHIRGALHAPLAHLVREPPARLARDRPIVVYCRDVL